MKNLFLTGLIQNVEIGEYTITLVNNRFVVRQTKTGFITLESSSTQSYEWVRDYCFRLQKN